MKKHEKITSLKIGAVVVFLLLGLLFVGGIFILQATLLTKTTDSRSYAKMNASDVTMQDPLSKIPRSVPGSMPGACADVFIPVCGSDGKTYGNECSLRQANEMLDCKGTCPCKNQALVTMVTEGSGPFVFKLTDPALIAQAKSMAGKKSSYFPAGKIYLKKMSYNSNWSYAFEPTSMAFAQNAIEECDGGVQWIQNEINRSGKIPFPSGRWCPWSGRVLSVK